jgi:hypothetical protein
MICGAAMRDPQEIISAARQGLAPPDWRVFTGKRSVIGGFFRGTSHDPDPLLVISSGGVVEYVSEKKPLAVVAFRDLSAMRLRAKATATTTSNSSFADAHLFVWLDLSYGDGRKQEWKTASFRNNLLVLQSVIETYAVYRAQPGP